MRRRRPTATSKSVSYFNSPTFGLCSAEFESSAPDTITKSALVMVEGEHIDSSKRTHFFDAKRIQRIVERTNNWMARGGRVPWQKDHKKTQEFNIGDLEGALEVRVITPDDLPNSKLKHLVGKVGAFAQELVGKGKGVVDDILAGNIKTLSPGIDINADIIREISATPTPAIVGLSTFKRHESGRFALTMEEAEQDGQHEDAMKESFEEIGETFWSVVNSLFAATEDELQGQEPQALMMQAVEDYSSRIIELLGLGDEAGEPYAKDQQQPPQNTQPYNSSAPMPGYLQRQQGMTRMNSHRVFAAFTLADMQKLDRAEFFSVPGFGPPPRQKKQGSLLGNVAKGALAVGTGAALARYAPGAVKAGMGAAKGVGIKADRLSMKLGTASGVKRAKVSAGIGAGLKNIRRQVSSDVQKVGRGIASTGSANGVRNAIGSKIQNVGASIKPTKPKVNKRRDFPTIIIDD